MKSYVAFLRAVNVAGHAIVKKDDLRDAFAGAGCKNARTFIQSGNVVFELAERDTERVLGSVRVRLRKRSEASRRFSCGPLATSKGSCATILSRASRAKRI